MIRSKPSESEARCPPKTGRSPVPPRLPDFGTHQGTQESCAGCRKERLRDRRGGNQRSACPPRQEATFPVTASSLVSCTRVFAFERQSKLASASLIGTNQHEPSDDFRNLHAAPRRLERHHLRQRLCREPFEGALRGDATPTIRTPRSSSPTPIRPRVSRTSV